jgi:hypothetical protein
MSSHAYIVWIAALSAGLALAACGSDGASAQGPAGTDPCAAFSPAPGQTCHADGATCICSDTEAGATGPGWPDAAAPDGAFGTSVFVGRWSPLFGSGEANCGGGGAALPPNPQAVITFTQDGAGRVTATSSGAPECALELRVSGDTASLAQASETCPVPNGDPVTFTTFALTFFTSDDAGAPPVGDGAEDAGSASDDGAADAQAPSDDAAQAAIGDDGGDDGATDAALSGDDASVEAGLPATDGGAPPAIEAGVEAGAPLSSDRLDWQLADGDGTCKTTLHYTLVRISD